MLTGEVFRLLRAMYLVAMEESGTQERGPMQQDEEGDDSVVVIDIVQSPVVLQAQFGKFSATMCSI